MTTNSPSTPSTTGFDVVVVGSLNVDLTTMVESIPRPGETVLGGDVQTFEGGKGLNQAIAAARAGASVAMVGRVGADAGGDRLRDRLNADAVDHTWVGTDQQAPSGAAFITVDQHSENAIVVSPGANATLKPEHVAAADVIRTARVVLIQLEVPMSVVAAAVSAASGLVIVNPAPAQVLPASVLERTSILVPNQGELATISGEPVPETNDPETDDRIVAMAAGMTDRVADGVIVTLGPDGVVLVDEARSKWFAPHRVEAVDTTGAGDCFCGSLAARLAVGDSVEDAITWALTAAALSVTRLGASNSMPTSAEVSEALRRSTP